MNIDILPSEENSLSETTTTKKRPLSTLRLAELQDLAEQMGLAVNAKMRRPELIALIREARSNGNGGAERQPVLVPTGTGETNASAPVTKEEGTTSSGRTRRGRRAATMEAQPVGKGSENASAENSVRLEKPRAEQGEVLAAGNGEEGEHPRKRRRRAVSLGQGTPDQRRVDLSAELDQVAKHSPQEEARDNGAGEAENARHGAESLEDIKLPSAEAEAGDEDERTTRRRGTRNQRDREDRDDRGGRRRRGRERNKRRNGREERDIEIQEDDVLIPIGGILEVQENHAFVRTSGYLPGPNDVYVTLGNVRRWGLRPGDAVVGAVRQPREGERQRQKYNALVRLDSVNGLTTEQALARREFSKLTPLYPTEQLRLETTPKAITPRIIDLVSPIGKGQRGLIVSPPKAGKTIIMQQIANAISQNNPEVHLMVVLVDERPEEVTDMQRTVKGEVIASTFDRPASDHTTVAELAIERAKRLVELGQDVVVLLDSITRLGRAYNLAAPASGRILSGGVDASALYPPKKFFGAARNIEDGGSLTIIASALVETGSKMDEVIFEEFKGTGNMELRLSRQLADRRIFPAVDVNASGTRREEMLFKKEELAIMWRLRRVLGNLEQQQALELMLDRLKDTGSNAEFLMTVAKTTPKDND